ncbi:MAG: DegV family protein [Bacilli bacterium]|nr:DegV family protein [Bacilli bacterium]
MHSFAIIADNSCALRKQYRERFGVDGIIYGTITYPDGHTEFGDLDYERITPEDYFRSISKKAMYKTACANIDQMIEVMEPFAKEGKDVVFITISSALSGTYNFGLKAAERVEKAYPGVHVYVIDSQRYASALGLLVQEACLRRDEGKSAKETAEWVESHKNNFHQMGMMDDLYFLARTGRIAKAKAFFGTMAGIKPMGEFSSVGLTEAIGKAKGAKNALDATVAYMKDRIVDPKEHIVFIAQSLREKEAKYLEDKIVAEIAPKEIISLPLDQTSGANMGPGLCAAFFYGKPISENLAEEKELINAILNK